MCYTKHMRKIFKFFKVNDSYKNAKYSLITSLLISLLSYNQFIINGYTNPDGIIEGLTSYVNATWHIVGCGRWFLPIIQSIFANINIPFVIVVFYCFFIWLAAFTITRIWNEDDLIFVVIISAVMCVTRTTLDHITTNSIAISDSIACFLSTFFVYEVFKNKSNISYLVCILCICLSLGVFQAYIGLSACLTLMTVIVLIIKNDGNELNKKIIKALICGICGVILYFICLKIIMGIFSLNASGRMKDVTMKNIVSNILPHIKYAYYCYFHYYNDTILHKNIINYIVIFLTLLSIIYYLFKKHDYYLFVIISLVLMPLASNIAILVMPEMTFATNMSYQNILIVPFAIISLRVILNNKIINNFIISLTIILCWLNIISVNATLVCYKLSHESIKYQMSEILDDVIHSNEYVFNETPVIFVGYPNDSVLRKNIKTYKYAYDFDEINNIAFWNNEEIGYTYNRQKYILNYFGIDIKDISFDEYLSIIKTNDFIQMPLWPNENSIKKINSILVVKLTKDPFIK